MKKKKKKLKEPIYLPEKLEPEIQLPTETKPIENTFPELNPVGVWVWVCGQLATQESEERGFNFPFFSTKPNLANAFGLLLC